MSGNKNIKFPTKFKWADDGSTVTLPSYLLCVFALARSANLNLLCPSNFQVAPQ